MKTHHYLNKLFLFCTCLFVSISVAAQKPKIGIVIIEDSELVCHYVGTTIFNNKLTPLDLDLNVADYMEQRIVDYIGNNYDIYFLELPSELKNIKLGIFESGIGKKISKWAKEQTEYEFLIFLKNSTPPNPDATPHNTSGLFITSKYAYFYTCMMPLMFYVSKNKSIQYPLWENKWDQELKNLKAPKDKMSFSPEMLDILKTKFENYLDSRIKYFIRKNYLF